MSDLQCAATLLFVRPDESGGAEREGERALLLADSLRGARVAKVYCSDADPAVRTGQVAATALGVPVEVRPGLRPQSAQESPDDLLARVTVELEGVVDLHRGETVLVVTHGEAIGLVLPRLAANLPAGFGRDRMPGPARITEVAADADGWVVRAWDGRPVAADREANT